MMKKAFTLLAGVMAALSVAAAPRAMYDLAFDIQITDIPGVGAVVSISPSPYDNSVTYYWEVFETAEISGKSDDEIVEAMKEKIEDLSVVLYVSG